MGLAALLNSMVVLQSMTSNGDDEEYCSPSSVLFGKGVCQKNLLGNWTT
jgi:hypothetical protein